MRNKYAIFIFSQLIQILYFAYCYFKKDIKLSINKFFNFDKSWHYDKIIEKAYNITWDIFLYSMSQNFLTHPSKTIDGKQFRADIGIPMFLTEDNKFFSSYIKIHSMQINIVDESSKGRPYISISNNVTNDKEFESYMKSFENKYPNISIYKKRRKKLFKSHSHLYSIYRLFKERMEQELKIYLINKK